MQRFGGPLRSAARRQHRQRPHMPLGNSWRNAYVFTIALPRTLAKVEQILELEAEDGRIKAARCGTVENLKASNRSNTYDSSQNMFAARQILIILMNQKQKHLFQ